jgi:hypothetical protein
MSWQTLLLQSSTQSLFHDLLLEAYLVILNLNSTFQITSNLIIHMLSLSQSCALSWQASSHKAIVKNHSFASNMAMIAFNHSTHNYLHNPMHIVITHIHPTLTFASNHGVWQSKFYFSYTTILDHDIMIQLVKNPTYLVLWVECHILKWPTRDSTYHLFTSTPSLSFSDTETYFFYIEIMQDIYMKIAFFSHDKTSP